MATHGVGVGNMSNQHWQTSNQDALDMLKSLGAGAADLLFSSPPYCIGKEYEATSSVDDFIREHKRILPDAIRAIKAGGSLCWQVGHHVANNVHVPLDAIVYAEASRFPELKLRNRIIWHFGHGIHERRRFSGRHETILWFTKGDDYSFNLDAVRVPQRYPGKKHYKGQRRGEWSGHPLGKNPSDVWDIPNVKAGHIEKTDHPCQFPVALAARLIRALTPVGGTVVDPYMGSGSTGVAAVLEGRKFVGSDREARYLMIADARLREAVLGSARVRADVPTSPPDLRTSVARLPPHFMRSELESSDG